MTIIAGTLNTAKRAAVNENGLAISATQTTPEHVTSSSSLNDYRLPLLVQSFHGNKPLDTLKHSRFILGPLSQNLMISNSSTAITLFNDQLKTGESMSRKTSADFWN